MNRFMLPVLALFLMASAGCRQPFMVPVYEEIAPNQTCYMVKLTGNTKDGQAKMDSSVYAESDRIQTKRIEIPQVFSQTGRMDHEGKWIPAAKLICQDRTPITREWTESESTGTTKSNQAVQCESVESINFGMGITVTGSIPESGTAKYMFSFANKPLSSVMDENVRGYFVSHLCAEFASMPLDNEYEWTIQMKDGKPDRDEDGKIIKIQGKLLRPGVRSQKLAVLTKIADEAIKYFADKGLELSNIGSSEGLSYKDSKIQDAINKAYTSKIDQETAAAERVATMTRANTYAEAAKKRADADKYVNDQAARSLSQMGIQEMWIRKWDGKQPQMVGAGVPLVQMGH